MKKLIFSTLVGSLLALAGCQQNEEIMDNSNTNGEKVTVTANIKGATDSRVALTPDNTDPNAPYVKVAWKESGEKFNVYGATGDVQEFTQASENQFSGTLPATTNDYYMASYNCTYTYDVDSEELELLYDLSQQDGTLNESYVMMSCEAEDTDPLTFNFKHHTFILKPTFKVGEETLANNTITKIVMGALEMPNKNDWDVETITIEREASADDIYIFVPQTREPFSNYRQNEIISFEVTAGGKEYTAEYTITNPSDYGLKAGNLYTATIALEEETPDTTPYVTFSATGAQTFKMTGMNNIPEQEGTLSYSTDGKNWTELTVEKGTEGISFGNGTDLRLKGTLTKGTGYYQYNYGNYFYYGATISFTDATVPVACTGDIRTLVAGKDYLTADTDDAAFCRLFNGCTQLTSAPVLPAEDLSTGCYAYMFSGCSGLTAAPALPAENLATGCYAYMFYGCSGLTAAPELNATALAESCYQAMFQNCTKLETAPTLPATQLAKSCYNSMFRSCTKLTAAPALNATQLATSCYNAMFRYCSKLTATPALNATKLEESCYYAMFANCTSLKTVTSLPATTLANSCYNMMFLECSALTTVPTTLSASTLYPSCYSSMFEGCTSLATAPTLPATTLAESCYDSMFDGCTNLTKAPELPAATLTDYCYQSMFSGCTSLNEITMLATNISANSCLLYWVDGVASSGTFKKKNTASWTKTQLGLPEGWTITNK